MPFNKFSFSEWETVENLKKLIDKVSKFAIFLRKITKKKTFLTLKGYRSQIFECFSRNFETDWIGIRTVRFGKSKNRLPLKHLKLTPFLKERSA